MVRTLFLSVQKVTTKLVNEKIIRRKACISSVSSVELEELNSELLERIVILRQKKFTERHTSTSLHVLLSFTFSCCLWLKIMGEQEFWFYSWKMNSLILSQKG